MFQKENNGDKNDNKEALKVTFTDVERLFMKLMKGANEEDWNCLANFERDEYTRIHRPQNKERLQCGILASDVTFFFDTLQKKANHVWSLFSVCRQSK